MPKDYKTVLDFIQMHAKIIKFEVKRNTFAVCICSDDYKFSACDDASTTYTAPDAVYEGNCLSASDKFYINWELKQKN